MSGKMSERLQTCAPGVNGMPQQIINTTTSQSYCSNNLSLHKCKRVTSEVLLSFFLRNSGSPPNREVSGLQF